MSALPKIPRWRTILYALNSAKTPLKTLNQIIYQRGKTVQLYLAGISPMMSTTDPDFVQHIMQKSQRKYKKSEKQFKKIKHFYGNGLLTSGGDYWKKQRKMVQPCFHKKRLHRILQLMDRVTDEFLEVMDREIESNSEINILDKMQELTFKIIANAIFSRDLRDEEFRKVKNTMASIQRFVIRMIRQPHLKWWFRLSGQIKAHEILKDEVGGIIRSYIERRKASNREYDDLLQMLLDVRYEDGTGMSVDQLIEEINVLFIAGHETSANALSWVWYQLSKHPFILKKLRSEVNRVLPEEEVSFGEVAQLGYTQQVIDETLRLFPPIWATSREAVEDDEFKGIRIKKGTMVGAYIYGLHHSPALWDQPESFIPERFEKEKKKTYHPYAFVPFGGGRRMCVGRQFALMEMKLIIAKMVKRYKMRISPDQDIDCLPLLNLQPKNGIKMIVKKREVWVRRLLCAS